eukprot:3825524-Amphidinium_carterae.1
MAKKSKWTLGAMRNKLDCICLQLRSCERPKHRSTLMGFQVIHANALEIGARGPHIQSRTTSTVLVKTEGINGELSWRFQELFLTAARHCGLL